MPIQKWIANGYKWPIEVTQVDKKFEFKFKYNKDLINMVKGLSGRRWNPDNKSWTADVNQRNLFTMRLYQGENVFARYDAKLIECPKFDEKLYPNQEEYIAHILTRLHAIIAGEMGTGKTIATHLAVQHKFPQISGERYWWVGPKSAVSAVEYDLRYKWKQRYLPTFMTYEEAKSRTTKWLDGAKAPKVIILDEFSKCKNCKSQRSQAIQALCDGVRSDWGEDSIIVGLSGTPAPKSPADWWSLAEIICPGFILEPNIYDFERRLSVIVNKQDMSGGVYPHRVCWLDKDNYYCRVCGETAPKLCHDIVNDPSGSHKFEPAKNEVALLGERLKGLVYVKFKKDCLGLPDKVYRIYKCTPTQETLRIANTMLKRARTSSQAQFWIRELSDGFIYEEQEVGKIPCTLCNATGVYKEWFDPADPEAAVDPLLLGTIKLEERQSPCPNCEGTGKAPEIRRVEKRLHSPKLEAVRNLLEEFEEQGRFVIYSAFTASINRIIEECHGQGWATIRIDGQGTQATKPDGTPIDVNINVLFQDMRKEYDKVVVVAHPESGGMAYTFTAACATLFYSNDTKGENRMQAEDRIHRLGMDLNLGATIIDFDYLPCDKRQLEMLKQKKDLQDIPLDQLVKDFANGNN